MVINNNAFQVASRVFNDGVGRESDQKCLALCQQGAQICLYMKRPMLPPYDMFDATKYNQICEQKVTFYLGPLT